jgi:hypothetical protein
MERPRRRRWGLLFGLVLIGCGPLPQEPVETGASACVRSFYEALLRKDWPKAYAALDAPSQKRYSAQQFPQLAQSYRTNLGFEPEAVQVQACEERGPEATAHVVLTGHSATHYRRYKDAITLRRGADWRVVLPSNFGQTRKR